jgi:hypothetical protein
LREKSAYVRHPRPHPAQALKFYAAFASMCAVSTR